ncbi:hypothetical protein T440DRAFT_399991 [Plenodomus tracheiphilus IPT5]|uniref:Uncharacterized protein n=1 Tax=Plenodomus tracheiphilus IPT5 TaxID=1408161 RepID=A0A6A7B052_9PLEO|nr:hypothetical protein T440DRAFT_399991 [Plenodomus tracheiphilus IPT5]
MPAYHISKISNTTFKEVLARYPTTVPEKLRDLDIKRYETIPATAIREKDGSANLTKDMVETLVEWKLKHGTFRPKLLSLVQSNDASTVLSTTTAASKLPKSSITDVQPALKILTQLKGIGPATASLLLSVLSPADVPFFSDELFRWCCWDEAGGEGWKRGIKYTAKEYGMLVEKVLEVRTRLGMNDVQAVHVEKVAWVLGREREDIDGDVEEKSGDLYKVDHEERIVEEKVSVKKGAAKRKIGEDIDKAPPKKVSKKTAKSKEVSPPAVGTRRSTRTQK